MTDRGYERKNERETKVEEGAKERQKKKREIKIEGR